MSTDTQERIEALEALARDIAEWYLSGDGGDERRRRICDRAVELSPPPTTWHDDARSGLAQLANLTKDDLETVREWFKSLERTIDRQEWEREARRGAGPWKPWAKRATGMPWVGDSWNAKAWSGPLSDKQGEPAMGDEAARRQAEIEAKAAEATGWPCKPVDVANGENDTTAPGAMAGPMAGEWTPAERGTLMERMAAAMKKELERGEARPGRASEVGRGE